MVIFQPSKKQISNSKLFIIKNRKLEGMKGAEVNLLYSRCSLKDSCLGSFMSFQASCNCYEMQYVKKPIPEIILNK